MIMIPMIRFRLVLIFVAQMRFATDPPVPDAALFNHIDSAFAPLADGLGVPPETISVLAEMLKAEEDRLNDNADSDVSSASEQQAGSDDGVDDGAKDDDDDGDDEAVEAMSEQCPPPPHDLATILEWGAHIHDSEHILESLTAGGLPCAFRDGWTVILCGLRIGVIHDIGGHCFSADCCVAGHALVPDPPVDKFGKKRRNKCCRLKLEFVSETYHVVEAICLRWVLAGSRVDCTAHRQMAIRLQDERKNKK